MMVRFILVSFALLWSHITWAQINQQNLIGKWQTRMVIGEDGDSSLNFNNIPNLREEMVKETLGYMTEAGMSYSEEDSLNLVADVTAELMSIFETTYHFKKMNELVLKTFQNRDTETPVSLVGQYTLDEGSGKLVMTVNNSPATLMIMNLSGNSMTAKDEAGSVIVFERIE
jgi:hypothetical protein